ncbi:MAG: hypothetical protein EA398_03850 [Deltaproteobacteria bacterium]|nr:MAG: hypothetical protein EA398_03850 [Deltaproteobacteria bacterium]
MIPVILVSDNEEWTAPLGALLRERDLDAIPAVDVFDVIPRLQDHPGALVVAGPDLDGDDARMLLAGLARRIREPVVLLCGESRDGLGTEDDAREAGFAGMLPDPWRFVALRDRLLALAPNGDAPDLRPPSASPEEPARRPTREAEDTPTAGSEAAPPDPQANEHRPGHADPATRDLAHDGAAAAVEHATAPVPTVQRDAPNPEASPDPASLSAWRTTIAPDAALSATWTVRAPAVDHADADAPLDREDIERLLRLARHEDYFLLLGLGRTATARDVRERATALRALLRPDRLSTRLLDRYHEAIMEIHHALVDAEAVLSSTTGRMMYLRGLREMPG